LQRLLHAALEFGVREARRQQNARQAKKPSQMAIIRGVAKFA
jgi:hypothetical protein